jgi:hypothetical protein
MTVGKVPYAAVWRVVDLLQALASPEPGFFKLVCCDIRNNTLKKRFSG